MSMVSYASGARYLSLIGGACLSFTTGTATCRQPPRKPGRADLPTCRNPLANLQLESYIIALGL
ncbi:molybdopterin-dependent oxidoreductase [Salmonella enterica subsp. enterica]|nr:molybdopterin-dependent oxidoreductase [Salmonella enterica subsp. enterica]